MAQVKDNNIQEIQNFISTLEKRFTPTKDLMQTISSHMLASVDANFINQGKDVPGGWVHLAVSTIMQKKRKNRDKRILFSEGNLARANQAGSTDDSAWVSNNKIYARTQHFGDEREIAAHSRVLNFKKYKAGKNKGKVQFSKERNATFSQKIAMAARRIIIPARPFMVLTEPFKNNIIDVINRHVNG